MVPATISTKTSILLLLRSLKGLLCCPTTHIGVLGPGFRYALLPKRVEKHNWWIILHLQELLWLRSPQKLEYGPFWGSKKRLRTTFMYLPNQKLLFGYQAATENMNIKLFSDVFAGNFFDPHESLAFLLSIIMHHWSPSSPPREHF